MYHRPKRLPRENRPVEGQNNQCSERKQRRVGGVKSQEHWPVGGCHYPLCIRCGVEEDCALLDDIELMAERKTERGVGTFAWVGHRSLAVPRRMNKICQGAACRLPKGSRCPKRQTTASSGQTRSTRITMVFNQAQQWLSPLRFSFSINTKTSRKHGQL